MLTKLSLCLDVGGAGFIVTVSSVVYTGSTTGEHKPGDGVAAVVSADLTLGYFYKIVNSTMPNNVCAEDSIRCFLLDDQGFVVAHPELSQGYRQDSRRSSQEAQHITHIEPLVASDILAHDGFMTKKLCRSNGSTLQRFFQLDTDIATVVTNLGNGEHCSRYRVASVPGTNLFLGVVNQTCDVTAFCPCSTVDRTCLNCRRMEQRECECPCECTAFNTDGPCTVTETGFDDKIPFCPIKPAKQAPVRFTTTRLTNMERCINTVG